ncbi:MAG: formylglycine-generating enzyme family protein [Holophagales bacterium]|nr:formylglycine-generating enzyme family protein [Holophagales bacterium]
MPPEVQVDRLWFRAERQIDSGAYRPALESLEEILSLEAQHDVPVPKEFLFKHAVALHETGFHVKATDSATKYLNRWGREGRHYREALELLDAAETAAGLLLAAARRKAEEDEREQREALEDEMAKTAAELARLAPGMEMVVIPPGSFRMGCSSSPCSSRELPVHRVTIPRPFAVSKHELTLAQWDACVDRGGCRLAARREDLRSGTGADEAGRGRRPVVSVSWLDARQYVGWLSSETGAEYRLLSESEWEYAARAGTDTLYSFGDDPSDLCAHANHTEIASPSDDALDSREPVKRCADNVGDRAAPVGSFSPNGWALFDMHGNVEEWVEDCWNDNYSAPPLDGSAWRDGDCSRRVVRGGAWNFGPRGLRSTSRNQAEVDKRYANVGFRIARTLSP